MIHGGFVHRLATQKTMLGEDSFVIYEWIGRLNSIGMVFPLVERIWNSWWKMDTQGKAICAVVWAAGLVYRDEENPLFGSWNWEPDRESRYLSESDSGSLDVPWLEENLEFLRRILSADYLHRKLLDAAQMLESPQEHQLALDMARQAQIGAELIEERRNWFLAALGKST